MKIVYKLTTQALKTYNGYQWTPGQWQKPIGVGNSACGPGVFHFYDDPRLAIIYNPQHANLQNPRIWSMQIEAEIGHDGLKGWSKEAKLLDEIKFALTKDQITEFSIRLAIQYYHDKSYLIWANAWLSGKDRSESAAESAAESARLAAWSAESAAWSARLAAWSAATAESAAESAAWSARLAAESAESAAESAAWSAATAKSAIERFRAQAIEVADIVFGKLS